MVVRPATGAAPAAPPSGDPPLPVCQRCGRRIDQDAIGGRVGLCHCAACLAYACRWCWADAAGACPGCGAEFTEFAVGPVAGVTDVAPAPVGRRSDPPLPVAIALFVIAALAIGVVLARPFGSAGGVAGATDRPPVALSSAFASAGLDLASSPPPSGALPGAVGTSTAPSLAPTAAAPTTHSPTTSTPDPATPAPRPTTRPAPTPRPTPGPTQAPAPTPAPACETVPNLVGLAIADARAAWAAAGFTGPLAPTNGHDRQTVLTQSETAGTCLAAASGIAVTY